MFVVLRCFRKIKTCVQRTKSITQPLWADQFSSRGYIFSTSFVFFAAQFYPIRIFYRNTQRYVEFDSLVVHMHTWWRTAWSRLRILRMPAFEYAALSISLSHALSISQSLSLSLRSRTRWRVSARPLRWRKLIFFSIFWVLVRTRTKSN